MEFDVNQLSKLNGKELSEELQRLRGSSAFSTHRGRVPKSIRNRDEAPAENKNAKVLVLAALIGAILYFYFNPTT